MITYSCKRIIVNLSTLIISMSSTLNLNFLLRLHLASATPSFVSSYDESTKVGKYLDKVRACKTLKWRYY